MRHKRVLIVSGMAPGRMLAKLFEAAPDTNEVTVFNAEPRANRDRGMLAPVLSGTSIEAMRDDLMFGCSLSERRAA